jgi:hypothetical protein
MPALLVLPPFALPPPATAFPGLLLLDESQAYSPSTLRRTAFTEMLRMLMSDFRSQYGDLDHGTSARNRATLERGSAEGQECMLNSTYFGHGSRTR